MSDDQRETLTITRTIEHGWVLAFQGAHWAIDAIPACPGVQQVRYDLLRLPDSYVLKPVSHGDPWAEIDTAVKPTQPLPDPPPRAATEKNAEQVGKLQAREKPLTTTQDDWAYSRGVDEFVEGLSDGQELVKVKHEDSGLRCLVAHRGDGDTCPCVQCTQCGEWIRPENMGQKCKGRTVNVPDPT